MDRPTFLSLLGKMPTKSALNLKVFEEVDCGTFVRQKIGYSSEAGETISAFLCIPKNINTSLPAIYCFHQHAGNWLLGKSEVVGLAGSPDQAYAKELAERGYITLAPDAICFEERADATEPIRYHAHQLHTSRIGREFGYLLSLLKSFALISPFERFSHCTVEVINKLQNLGLEVRLTHEVRSLE